MDRRVEARVKIAQDEDCHPDVSDILPLCPLIKFAEPTRAHGLLLSAECAFVIKG
jgi:hypothetical protein